MINITKLEANCSSLTCFALNFVLWSIIFGTVEKVTSLRLNSRAKTWTVHLNKKRIGRAMPPTHGMSLRTKLE
jgi:hypothetical protein